MSPLLVLLALLALGTLAARRGSAEAVAVVAAAPLLLATGWVLSPQGLGFLYPSLVRTLATPTAVAASWLTLLVGLRAMPAWSRAWLSGAAWLTLGGGAVFVFTGMTAMAVCAAWPGVIPGDSPTEAFAWAVAGAVSGTGLVGALRWTEGWADGALKRRVQFVALHDDVFGGCSVLALLSLTQLEWPTPVGDLPSLAVVLGAAAVLAVAAYAASLVTGRDGAWMPLAAVTAMGAGVSLAAGWPGILVTMAAGAVLGLTGLGRRLDPGPMQATDRPLRLLVTVLAGMQLELTWGPVMLGVALAAARLVGKVIQARMLALRTGEPLDPQVMLGSSGLAIPLAVALVNVPALGPRGGAALCSVATCVVLTELLVLALGLRTWLQSVPRRSITAGVMRRVEATQGMDRSA